MSIFLGQLARLVELKCPADQQVSSDERYTFETTAEGRVRGQVRPARGRRIWTLGTSDATTPQDQGAILSFVNGEWGPGPFVFVSADAPTMNMLSPDAASCSPSGLYWNTNSAAGPMLVGDTWAGRSFANSDTSYAIWFSQEETPVFPGEKVTASAWVRGAGAAVRVKFYDTGGTNIATVASTVTATAGTAVRSHVTATPPALAVSCRVEATKAVQAARPSLTWTSDLLPWADGQGCPRAVLHGASRSLVMASREARYSSIQFTVTEVG